MKIVNRKDFLKLENVLYTEYKPCIFNGLKIKGKTRGNDFLYDDLIAPICPSDAMDFSDCCKKAEEGEEVALDFDYTSRDGLFEEDQLYAIYSKKDVENLIRKLKEFNI